MPMIRYTNHAISKLTVYGITLDTLAIAVKERTIYTFTDTLEDSFIRIVEIKGRMLVLVSDVNQERVITIYTTDISTVRSRKRSGRWI